MEVWEVIVFFIIVFVVAFIIFQFIYNKNLFSPSNDDNSAELKDLDYNDFYLGTKTGEMITQEQKDAIGRREQDFINVWTFEKFDPENKKKKTILFFHGNSGNISHRSYIIDLCKKLEVNLMLVDYRGYGKSDGTPETGKLCRDGEVAYEYLLKTRKSNEIVVWGESLGGSVATYVASKYGARCLVLLSTFSSLSDVINMNTGVGDIVKSSVSGYIKITGDDMNSKEWIKHIRCPVIMIHSLEDDVISYKCAKKLFKLIKGNHKKLITIKGPHSKPNITEGQLNEIFAFIGIKRHNQDLKKLTKNLQKVAEEHDWA